MKRILHRPVLWGLPAALLASSALTAQADNGPYVGIEGAVNWESPQDLKAPPTLIDRLHFHTGWAAGLTGGYSFSSGWRPELEVDYRRNNLDHDFFGPAGGHDNADSALANLWYAFKAPTGLFSVLHPYLGGGAGAVRSYYGDAALTGVGIQNDYGTEFGYQAGAGVGYDVTAHLTLSLDYRHLWTNRGSFHDDTNSARFSAPAPVRLEQRYLAQTAMLSVRYAFGESTVAAAAPEPQPPAPALAPQPQPPPPPPPVAIAPPACNPPAGFQVDANCHIIEQSVVVRAVDFAFNSTQLTEPAQQTLDQVASALTRQPQLQVEIQGYTDSRGPAAYNLKLSQQRAQAVLSYLVSKGVNGSTLTARGYGKVMPLASNDTAQGRAENRRVVFEVTNAPAHIRIDSEGATPATTEAAEQGEHSRRGR